MEIEDYAKVSDVFTWSYATLLQVQRIEAAFFAEQRARREGSANDSELAVVRYADTFFLLTAANHLVTALGQCKKRLGLPEISPSIDSAITSLRDVYEHWNQSRVAIAREYPPKKGRARLLGSHPDAAPFTFQWSRDTGVTIARALNLNELRNEVIQIAKASRDLLNAEWSEGTSPDRMLRLDRLGLEGDP